jgi:hypothetical protein
MTTYWTQPDTSVNAEAKEYKRVHISFLSKMIFTLHILSYLWSHKFVIFLPHLYPFFCLSPRCLPDNLSIWFSISYPTARRYTRRLWPVCRKPLVGLTFGPNGRLVFSIVSTTHMHILYVLQDTPPLFLVSAAGPTIEAGTIECN